MKKPKVKTVRISLKHVNTGELFQTDMDLDILKMASPDRGIEVIDKDNQKRKFRRDFLEII